MTNKYKMSLLLLCLFFTGNVFAQFGANNYSFSESTGTYSAISGTTTSAVGDDGIHNGLPIGFTFNFGGVSYTHFCVTTNGFLKLGSSTTTINTGTPNYSNNLGGGINEPLIAGFWDDNSIPSGTGNIQYLLQGSLGSQTLTVQWTNMVFATSGTTPYVDFQIVLHETSDIIEVIYGGTSTATVSKTAAIGIETSIGNFLSVTPNVAGATYSTTTANNSVTISATSALPSGLTYTFTPPPPCGGMPVAGTVVSSNMAPCLNSSINLSLNGGTVATGLNYQWYTATSLTGPWSPEGTSQASAAISPTPIVPGNNYYYCEVSCGASVANSDTITIIVPTPFPGGTYTVNSAVPTGGNNFQSFTDALAALGCGITGPIVLDVAPGSGPYNEQIIVPPTIGTTVINTFTINGNGAIVQYTPTTSYQGILMLDGADYVKIDSLTFKSLSSTYGFGAILYNGCDYDSITRCTFDLTSVSTTSSANCGMLRITTTPSSTSSSASGATNTYIGDCQFLGNAGTGGAYYGVYCYGPNTNNVYHNNLFSNYYYYGIYDYYGDNVTYSNNTLTRETKNSGVAGGYYGFYMYYAANGAKITGNRIEYLGGSTQNSSYSYPFNIFSSNGTSTTPILIANNIISNMTASPYYGMRISGGSYLDIYHNTISIDDAVSYTNANYGIYTTSSPANCNIKNNIVTITGGGTSTKYGFYYGSAPASSDNNDVYVNSTQSGTQNFGYSGGAQANLSAWQTATSMDMLSLDIDPMYLSAATGDFTPTNFMLDNMGTPHPAVVVDINGLSRDPNTPDIGAIEFTIPPCTGTPSPVTISGIDSVCVNAPFTLTAAGMSIATGISYDWQFNDGSGWFSTGGTGTSYTATVGIMMPTDFRMVTYCANSNGYDTSNVISITIKQWYNCYCEPISTCVNEGIQNVTFNTLNNSSNYCTNSNGYEDFSSLGSVTTVTQGAAVPISVTAWINSNPAGAGVWIDYDQNGVFDTTEFTLIGTTSSFTGTAGAFIFSNTVTIDINALTGLTRMRVRSANSTTATQIANTTACLQSNAYGEYEDYLITIAPASNCSGTPNVVTASSAVSSVCPSESFNISAANATTGLGMVYEWQYDDGNGWQTLLDNNFAPVSSFNYAVPGITVPTSYRFISTCSGGGADTSNTISLTVNGFMACYCTPTGGGHTTYGINDFSTSGGWVNISNMGTGPTSAPGYQDYSATHMLSTSIGNVITIMADGTGTSTYGWAVWVDWNKNGRFDDPGETMYNSTGYIASIPANTTFTVPALDGNNNPVDTGYRKMRVIGHFLNSNPSNDYCSTTNTNYAEWEDYMVNIVAPPSCLPPSNPYSSNVLATSADLYWTENNGATTWVIEYGPSPLTQGTGTIITTTTNPHSILSGLTPSTNYDFYVRSICTPGVDTSLAAMGTILTACATYTAPFVESFNTSTTPNCWTVTNSSSGGTWYYGTSLNNGYGISSAADHTGNSGYFAWVDGSSPITTGQITMLTSPIIDIASLTSAQLRYYMISYTTTTSSGFNKLAVDAYDFNISDWVPVDSVQQNFSTQAWEERVAPLTSVTSTLTQLRFRFEGTATTTFYNDILIDDIHVEQVPTCPAPTNGTAFPVAASTADLNWTENGSATQWEIEYGPSPLTLGNGTRIVVNSNPYTLNPPLNQATGYTYFVRSICGPNDTSTWSSGSNFTTTVSCPAPTGISISNITANSFDVNWTSTTGTEILEYGPTGHIPGTGATAGVGGTLITNATPPYTITGLSAFSGYDVFIRQDCSASSNGYSLNLSRNVATTGAPVNDTICGAMNLTLNNPVITYVNTDNATTTSSDPAFGCTTPNNNVWFKFTTNSAGIYNITAYSTQVTSYNTYYGNMSAWMWLYSATGSCPTISLTQIADLTQCNATLYAPAQYPVPQNTSRTYATPALAAASTYYFLVDGADGSYGNIGFTVQAPLAIKLEKLTAMNAGAANKVEWTTLSEERSDKFELERSADGKHFAKIYEKQANGEASRYTYMDNNPVKGMNYYRLRMTEANGQATYSEVVTAFVKSNGFEVNAYPNPVSHDLTVQVSGVQGADATVQVMDVTGKVINTIKMTGNVETLDMSSLANGIYLIKYSDADHTQTIRVNKQ